MDVKAVAQREVTAAGPALVELSHTVHSHPELAFEEERAARVGGRRPERAVHVEAGVCDIPTAFVRDRGSGPLTIAICAEYDALPRSAMRAGTTSSRRRRSGAGLALAPLADELGITVKVIGTPAEERRRRQDPHARAGRVRRRARGDDGAPGVRPTTSTTCRARRSRTSRSATTATTAHASAYPELGLNAADALTVAQTAIGLLRQHIKHTDRIHGIVHHGGDAPNVVPHETSGRWYVRAKNLKQLAELEPRVERCFEAGALATGCTVDVEKAGPPYSEFEHDKGLAALYRSNAESLGRKFLDLPEAVASGSPDPPTWRTSHSRCRASTRCSASTASRRRTTSPSSLPRASRRRPTKRWSTVPLRWPGRSSTRRRTRRRGSGCRGSAGMSADAAAIDPDKLKAYSFLLFSKLEGAITSGMVHLGDRLGLYRGVADAPRADGPRRTGADATGLNERWVREWAHNQAAAAPRGRRTPTASSGSR